LDPSARIAVEIGKTTDHHKQGDIFKAEARIIEPKAEYFAEYHFRRFVHCYQFIVSMNYLSKITKSKDRHRTLLKRGSSMIKKLLRL
jgi:hypothetical protein